MVRLKRAMSLLLVLSPLSMRSAAQTTPEPCREPQLRGFDLA